MFWKGVERLGERWDVVGGAICGGFVVGGAGAVWGKGWWWGRWVDGKREGDEGRKEEEVVVVVEMDEEHGQGKPGEMDKVGGKGVAECEEGIVQRESSDAIRYV